MGFYILLGFYRVMCISIKKGKEKNLKLLFVNGFGNTVVTSKFCVIPHLSVIVIKLLHSSCWRWYFVNPIRNLISNLVLQLLHEDNVVHFSSIFSSSYPRNKPKSHKYIHVSIFDNAIEKKWISWIYDIGFEGDDFGRIVLL